MTDAARDALLPEAATPAMSPGARLAQARIAHGMTIESIAQQLKFSSRQIDALEGNRYDELPGVAVVRGMVRGYARIVQLDAAPLLEALKTAVPAPDSNRIIARYRQPVPFSDVSKRSNVVYVIFTIAVLAVAALVLVQWRQDRPAPARMTFVPAPEPVQPPAPTTVASAGGALPVRPEMVSGAPEAQAASPAPATDTADAEASAALDDEPAAAGDSANADGSGARVDATQTAAAPATSEAATRAAGASEHRVRLEFAEDAWVEIRDAKGRVLHAQLNSGGSEVSVDGKGPLSFVIGNAQFVRLNYDGRSVDLTPYIKVAVARFTLP